MIKQIWTLNKYAYGRKSTLLSMFLVPVIGTALKLLLYKDNNANTMFIDLILLIFSSSFHIQSLFSLNISGMVSASPQRRRMQTLYPSVLSFLSSVWMLFLLFLVDHIVMYLNPSAASGCTQALWSATLFYSVILAGLGIAYKYFLFYTIPTCFLYSYMYIRVQIHTPFSYTPTAFLCVALLLIACLLQYALFLLFYKKPISKNSMGESLRRQL